MATLETEPVPSTSAAPAEPKKDLPWMKCVAGCVVDENLEVISLRCFHSICSEGCVLKLKRQSQKHGEEEKLFCGQCGLHIEEGDLQRKLTPSKVFISKPDASIKCEHCVLNTNAVAYCPDCPACLCEECKRMHPLTRVTQHHKVQDSLEGYKPKEQPDKKCDLHGGAAKIFYCYSCNEKICARCKPNHERHVVINMVNAQEKLKTTAESASALHERSCGAAKDIEHKLDELKSSWSSIIGEINDEFAMLLISLMGRQDRIKFEAKKKFLKKLADIQTTSYSVAKVKSHSGNIVKVIDEIVNNRDELAAANFLKHYKPFLQDMFDMKHSFEKDYDEYVANEGQFKVNADVHKLLKSFGEFGKIEYQLKSEEEAAKATPPAASGSSSSATPKPSAVSKTVTSGSTSSTTPKPMASGSDSSATPKPPVVSKPVTSGSTSSTTPKPVASGSGSTGTPKPPAVSKPGTSGSTSSTTPKPKASGSGSTVTPKPPAVSKPVASGSGSSAASKPQTVTNPGTSGSTPKAPAVPKPAASGSIPSTPPMVPAVDRPGADEGGKPPSPKKGVPTSIDPSIVMDDAEREKVIAELCKSGPITTYTLHKMGLFPQRGQRRVARKSTGMPPRVVNLQKRPGRKPSLSPKRSNANRTVEIVEEDDTNDNISNGRTAPGRKDVGVEVVSANKAQTSTTSSVTVPTATPSISAAPVAIADNAKAGEIAPTATSKEAFIPPMKASGSHSVPSSSSSVTLTKDAANNPEQISTTAVDETALETGSDNDGPNGTTADFSSPSNEGKADDQELGLGKRTRRPKYFPDHVSPEDTLRVYKPAKNSGGGVKRGGTTGLTPTTSIKMPRLVPEGLIDPVSTDPVSIDPVLIDPVDIKKEKVNETEEETGEVEEPVIPGSSKELQEKVKEPSSTEVSPVCPQKRGRGRPRKIKTLDLESFESATESSIEEPADNIEYPIQGNAQMKITDYDDSEDYCKICFDGGTEIIVCCDTCPNVFHVNCHVPLIKVIPGEDEPFYCFNCTSKQMIDERLATLPPVEGSEDQVLEESNEHHFALACKFTMECHLIPEIPTVRWIFPRLYHVVVGKDKVPFHLKYIRERLTLGQPAPFPNLRTFVLSFRQMFIQAFIYYQNYEHAKEHLPVIHTCFQKFLALLEEYYPSFRKDFDDVVMSAGSFNKKKK